jgi:hypothetical protein
MSLLRTWKDQQTHRSTWWPVGLGPMSMKINWQFTHNQDTSQMECTLHVTFLLVESKGLPIEPQNLHLQRTISLPQGINICHEPSCEFPSNLAVTTRYLKDFMSLQAYTLMKDGSRNPN